MLNRNNRPSCLKLIFLFVFLRMVLNLFALQHYGFQRDELLHIALGDHLDWGFKEVPPFIAFIAKIQTNFLGTYLFATRVFTTLASGLIILMTGLLTMEFGGRKFAISIACLSLMLSPAFLASGYLFQPVVFDQLWWLLSAYFLVKYFNSSKAKYLYFLGLAIGLGMLTKYTMAFFTLALVTGILLTKQREIFARKDIWIAVFIGVAVFMPNIIWQVNHHLPLVTHMNKLRNSMLEYIKPTDFMLQQLLVNGAAIWVWLAGLCFLLFTERFIKYRFLGYAYLVTLVLFLLLHGKIYYLFGAYPMLFAAGGFAFEYWIGVRKKALRIVAIVFFTLPNLLFLPLALPVLRVDQALPVFDFISQKLKIDFPFKWEDQKVHQLTQDYSDMLGWDELYLQVAATYKDLTPEQRAQTIIFANNYGEAGAIHHYGYVYSLPDVVSLNSSFALWAPENITAKYIIYIDATGGRNTAELLKNGFIGGYKKTGEINNPLARERGTAVFLLTDLKPTLNDHYREELLKTRRE